MFSREKRAYATVYARVYLAANVFDFSIDACVWKRNMCVFTVRKVANFLNLNEDTH